MPTNDAPRPSLAALALWDPTPLHAPRSLLLDVWDPTLLRTPRSLLLLALWDPMPLHAPRSLPSGTRRRCTRLARCFWPSGRGGGEGEGGGAATTVNGFLDALTTKWRVRAQVPRDRGLSAKFQKGCAMSLTRQARTLTRLQAMAPIDGAPKFSSHELLWAPAAPAQRTKVGRAPLAPE